MAIQVKLCWFNQRWNVYIRTQDDDYGYQKWNKVDETTKKLNGGTYRLTTYEHGGLTFYSYGFLTDDLNQRPGHNGEWSSNCKNINNVFGINITEVGIDGMSTAIDIDKLKELIGDKYIIVSTNYGIDVLSADHSDHDYFKWVTV